MILRGTKRMRYPGNDPENGPAYLQEWNGAEWICAEHRWSYDEADHMDWCSKCGVWRHPRAEQ
jgi:hypothetical protein